MEHVYSTSPPRHLGIIANLSKSDAIARVRELLRILEPKAVKIHLEAATAAALGAPGGLSLLDLADRSDVLIVLGGDGTILHTASQLGGRVKPLAGLNLGRLGFMTTAMETQAKEVVDALLAGNFRLSHRSVLKVGYLDTHGRPVHRFGLNEVALTRGTISRSIHVEILANGVPLNRFSGDGVILATPTGSTAYSLSAGGPLVTPDAKVFVVTAVCPHTLTSRAIVLPDDTICTLSAADSREEILLTVDGGTPTHFQKDSHITVQKADHTVPLVTLPDASFYRVLQDKLRWLGSNLDA